MFSKTAMSTVVTDRSARIRDCLADNKDFEVLSGVVVYKVHLRMTLTTITTALQRECDTRQQLDRLREILEGCAVWPPGEKNWARDIIRATQPDGTFTTGGDRKSAKYRDANHQALVSQPTSTVIETPAANKLEPPHRWCPVLVTPSPSNPTVCGVCHDMRVAAARPTFSDATVKRNHRGWCALESMAHPRVLSAALLVFDAPLPIGTDGRTTYCVEELYAKLNRLGFPVVRDQFLCPNIDATVVTELQQRGFIHAAHLCGCLYLQRYQSVIRDRYGGIALLFADVWGGFDAGAYRVLELSVNLRLLEPSAGTFVTFAACARGDRGRKRDADEATDDVSTFQAVERKGMELLRGYAGGHGDAVSVPPSAGVPLRYGPGKLMHVHAWRWQPRGAPMQ
jgi:hypothetical protein